MEVLDIIGSIRKLPGHIEILLALGCGRNGRVIIGRVDFDVVVLRESLLHRERLSVGVY